MVQDVSITTTAVIGKDKLQAFQADATENGGKQDLSVSKTAVVRPVESADTASPNRTAKLSMSTAEAQRAARAAVATAKSVVSTLESTAEALTSYADVSSLSQGVADMMHRIDALIAGTPDGGARFITSSLDLVSIRSGAFGGGTAVATQPFDFEGLGLEDIQRAAEFGMTGPVHMVQTAISLATDRMGNLEKLHKALRDIGSEGSDPRPDQNLLAAARSAHESRGTAVDLAA